MSQHDLTDQEIVERVKAAEFLGLCADYGQTVDAVLATGVSDYVPQLYGELFRLFPPDSTGYKSLK